MRHKIIIYVFSILFCFGLAFAEVGNRLEVDGYLFKITTNMRGKILYVRGEVKGGKKCNKLTIDIFLHDKKGNICHVVPIVNNYSYSAKFSISDDLVWKTGSRWNVSNIYIKCY
jgi:hypothetical protein